MLVSTQHRAPALVADTQKAVSEIGHQQRARRPDEQELGIAHHGKKQSIKPGAQQRACHRCPFQECAGAALVEGIAPASQQRVKKRVKQAGEKEDSAERCHRDAERLRIVIGQHHIQGECNEGQRQTHHPVAQALPDA